MTSYIYDGSFQGFLTSCYDAIENNDNPVNISIDGKFQPDLFSDKKIILSDGKKSLRLLELLKKKFTYEIIKNLYYAFLSENHDIEKNIFDYIALSLKYGKNIDGFHSNDCVGRINDVVQNVTREKHKFIGIIRFKVLKDEIYYSSIEPDNNITALLTNHFKKRFSNQKWLIHDVRRNIGAYYDLKSVSMISIADFDRNILSFDNESGVFHENEIEFQKLWKTYFKNICIKERINPNLQRQFIPLRYWKYLIEKN
jgi:probable DNA metabolism protein